MGKLIKRKNTHLVTGNLSRDLILQLSQMDDVTEVVMAALEEEENTYTHLVKKVACTLSSAEVKKRYGTSTLSQAESDAKYEDLTRDYLDQVLQIVTENDGEMMREVARYSNFRSSRKQLKVANRKLLSG